TGRIREIIPGLCSFGTRQLASLRIELSSPVPDYHDKSLIAFAYCFAAYEGQSLCNRRVRVRAAKLPPTASTSDLPMTFESNSAPLYFISDQGITWLDEEAKP